MCAVHRINKNIERCLHSMEQQARRVRRKRRRIWPRLIVIALVALTVFGIGRQLFSNGSKEKLPPEVKLLLKANLPKWVDKQIIPVDGAARRGEKLEELNSIVIHYVGNPKTTAQQNRDFYTNKEAGVSSHFVVGLKGEILQCVPLDEKSSASNHRNRDTISIENCHPDESGKFTQETYDSLVKLTAWLCFNSGLNETQVIRHYDITEKECPVFFVKNEEEWANFLADVKIGIEQLKAEQ